VCSSDLTLFLANTQRSTSTLNQHNEQHNGGQA
jgi:hypothetical protein